MISLITSLYRSEVYLPKYAMRVRQVYQDLKDRGIALEVVIIANDPSDKEKEVLVELQQFSWVKLCVVPRETLYASWNRGVREATFDILGFWNVDDERYSEALVEGVRVFGEKKTDVGYFPFVYKRYLAWRSWKVLVKRVTIDPPEFSAERFVKEMHAGPFFLFTKNCFERIGPFDDRFKIAGDFEWCARAAATERFQKIDTVAGVFINTGTSLSGSKNPRQQEENQLIWQRKQDGFLGNATTSSPSIKHLEYIDAVRGLAILLVIFIHVGDAIDQEGLVDHITLVGRYGVQLFFVASALTLFLSYSQRSVHEGASAPRNFFIRRLARIAPAYYVAAVIDWLAYAFFPSLFFWEKIIPWKVGINLLFINSFFPQTINHIPNGGWSVSVEMIFYCLVPWLFRKITSFKQAVRYFVLTAVGSQILNVLVRLFLVYGLKRQAMGSWFLYFWFPNQVSVFLLGIVVFFAFREKKMSSRAQKLWLLSGIPVIISFVVRYFWDTKNLIPEHILISIFFAALIYYMAHNPCRIVNNTVTRFLGMISFSLFLLHYLVIRFLVGNGLFTMSSEFFHICVLYGVTLVVSSGISYVMYRCVERPGIRLGAWIIKKISPPTT